MFCDHLGKTPFLLYVWFENNYMKLNTDQFHQIVLGCKHEQVWVNIRKYFISEINDVLRIAIDKDL